MEPRAHLLGVLLFAALPLGACSCDSPVGLDAPDAGDVDATAPGTDASEDAGVDGSMPEPDGGDDGGLDAGVDAGDDSGVDAGADAGDDGGVDASVDAGADAGDDGGVDAGPPECVFPADCDTLHGPAVCGDWTCPTGRCVAVSWSCADVDGDGYGVGPSCACLGPDCDDNNPLVADTGLRSCYSADPLTRNVGACRDGQESCTAGLWGPCVGEVVPSGEACNNEDDDCDGQTDEDLGTFSCGLGLCAQSVPACGAGGVLGVCAPGAPAANDTACDGQDNDCDGLVDEDCNCVRVAWNGSDAAAVADANATPFATIQAAIDWSAATPTAPSIVCVAAGAACGVNRTYAGDVTMADGISVSGGYQTGNWTSCANSTTTIRPVSPLGVQFPSTIVRPTVLSGFQIDRATLTSTAAVTVDGAHNVTLANLQITNTPIVTTSIGVDVKGGADVLLTRSNVWAGTGTSQSIGVRAVGSRVVLRQNCQTLDAQGRCNTGCGGGNLAIRGRFAQGTGETYAVLLQDAAGSVVEQTALCGNDADTGATLRIGGRSAGIVVRASFVNAWGGATDSHGIWMEDCAGEAPWIVDNYQVAAAGDTDVTRVDAIRAVGDCHPVIDSNRDIVGGGEGGTSGTNAIYCGANASGASRCVVLGNPSIRGSGFGFPPTSVGVRCDDGACNRIADNVISGVGGIDVWGLIVGRSGPVVERNTIAGGCPLQSATGVLLDDSWARLENNFIAAGGRCVGSASAALYRGLHVVAAAGPREVDVHSNDIDGSSPAQACTSVGIDLAAGPAAPPAGAGIFRNDIVRAGACPARYGVREATPAADPRVFENNDLDPFGTPTALYLDEAATALQSGGAVDALTDMTVGGTLNVDCQFVSYPANLHLQITSPCIGKGTPTGAPATDFEGDLRDLVAPDIGADER